MESDGRQKLIEKYVDRVLELEEDLELVEAVVSGSGRSTRLRVFIYKPDGVTIEDCARVSRRLSRELEHAEELDEFFDVEVSSLGLERKLMTRRDFERAVGEVLRLEIEGEEGAHTLLGLLTEVDEETLLLDQPPRGKGGRNKGVVGEPARIPLSSVREGSIEVLL